MVAMAVTSAHSSCNQDNLCPVKTLTSTVSLWAFYFWLVFCPQCHDQRHRIKDAHLIMFPHRRRALRRQLGSQLLRELSGHDFSQSVLCPLTIPNVSSAIVSTTEHLVDEMPTQ